MSTVSVPPPRIILDDAFLLDGPRPEDAAAHRRFALDPDAARFLGWTIEEARAAPDSYYEDALGRFVRGWESGARLSLVIRRRSNEEAVGTVELRPRGARAEADVSYLVAPDLRSRGLATRALGATLDWAARELGLRQATVECDVENTASRRVAEKCGFTLVGRFGDRLRFHRELEGLEG